MSAWFAIYSDGSEVPLGVARPSPGLLHQWRLSGPHAFYGLPYRSLGHDECFRCAICQVARCEDTAPTCPGKP